MTNDATVVGEGLTAAVPTPRRLAWYALLFNPQFVLVVLYYAFSTAAPGDLRYVAYGLVWITPGWGPAIVGLLGILSCFSCTRPILAAIAAALFGGTGFLATTAMEMSYDLSTVVFLATVALLYWRPGFG